MNTKKYFATFCVVLFALTGFSGCNLFKKSADFDIEVVLPKDSDLVVSFDYSNEGQVKKFKEIVDSFPELGVWDAFIDGYNNGVYSAIREKNQKKIVYPSGADPNPVEAPDDSEVTYDFSYDHALKPILDGQWNVAFGMKIPEDYGVLDANSLELYFVGKFSESEKFLELMNASLDVDGEVERVKDGEFEYFTVGGGVDFKNVDTSDGPVEVAETAPDGVYIVKYRDIFVLTNSELTRESAVERIKSGDGFNNSNGFLRVGKSCKENLGYVFANYKKLAKIYEYFVGGLPVLPADIADVLAVVGVDDDGIGIFGSALSSVESEKCNSAACGFVAREDNNLKLIDKVPLNDAILYLEDISMQPLLKAVAMLTVAGFESFAVTDVTGEVGDAVNSGMNSVLNAGPGGDLGGLAAVLSSSEFVYGEFLRVASSFSGISTEDVRKIVESPFSIAVSNISEFYPSVALYSFLDESSLDAAKKIVSAVDSYADQLLVELDKELATSGILPGLLKKETVLVNGGGLHKISVDWSVFPKEVLASVNIIPNFDITKIRAELYYGITGDNVLVFALYPGFAEDYAKNTILNNERFKNALAKMGGDNHESGIFFFDFEPLIRFYDKEFELLNPMGVITPEVLETYKKVKDFVSPIGYFIGGSYFVDEVMYADFYLNVNKVIEKQKK